MSDQEFALGLEGEGDLDAARVEASAASHGPVRTRQLFSNAMVFMAAAAFQRAIAFLLLPLTTRALDPTEYGQLAIALSAMLLAAVLFGLGFDYAVFRLYLARDADSARQERVVLSTWATVGVVGAVGAIVLSAAAWLLLAPGLSITGPEATLAFVAAAFAAGTLVPLSVLRAAGRVGAFVAVNVTIALASAGLILLCVVVLGWGPIGWLGAAVVANALGVGVAIHVVPLPRMQRFDPGIVRGALKVGVPLLPHFASHWALQLADRLVLATLVTDSKVGLYSLAGNFGLVAMIAVQGLNQAVMPTYARAAHDHTERARLAHLAVLQVVAVSLICITVALFGPLAVHLLLPADYGGAAALIPWITLGYAFLGFYFIPMNEVSLSVGRTGWIWVGTASAAAVDILALFIFVPSGGIMAAAVASAAAYVVLLTWLLLYRHRHGIVKHDVGGLLRAVGGLALVYAGAVATTGSSDVGDLFARAAWMLLVPVVMLALGIVSWDDARSVVRRQRPRQT